MTRRSPREIERSLDDLAGDRDGGTDEMFVVAIGGDPDTPRGWLTREEYEQHYGDWSKRGGARMVNSGGRK